MGTDDINPPKSGRRWTDIALIVSVALNLLIAGIVVGAMLGRDNNPRRPDANLSSYGPFTRALSEEDQRAVRQAVREKGDPREHRRALRVGFNAFLRELRHSPYNPEAAAAALDIQHQLINGQVLVVRDTLLDRIETMSDAERSVFADRLEKAVRSRRKPDQKDKP